MRLEPFRRRLDPASRRPIAVAVSGGADSLYALHLTLDWAGSTGRSVIALNVDHGLQARSAAWAVFVEDMAARLGAQFRPLSWDAPKPASGLPATARRARHALLAQAARDAGCAVVVTGHTGDDMLENVALGQGALTEWSPSPVWPEGRGIFLLRPLLGLRRAQIRQTLADNGVAWIDDPSNDNPAQPRVAARRAIARSGLSAPPPEGEEEEHHVARLARSVGLARDALTLPRASFLTAPPVAQRKVLAAAMVSAGGGERTPRGEKLDRLLDRLKGDGPFCATLTGARLSVAAGTMTITREVGDAIRKGLAPLHLQSGEMAVWDGRYEIGVVGEPVEIRPLKGLAASLGDAEERRLRTITPASRPGLPAFITKGRVTCPILAEDLAPGIRPLTVARFLAACGVTARESEL